MRAKLFLTLLLILNSSVVLAQTQPSDPHPQVEAAHKELMKLGARGFEPSVIKLPAEDGSVFFVNTASDALVSIAIDFGKHRAHCASANMKFENGVMRSIEPIGPHDFAVTCFPEAGSYSVKAQGLDGSDKIYSATVVVQ